MGTIKKYGIDISTWQGNIDLSGYKNQFVIIRAGFDITKDNKCDRNVAECERLGIPYGFYWYSYALTPSQAVQEAEACYKVIKKYKPQLGVWFDMEDADHWKRKHGFSFTRSNISTICNKFCDYFARKGYYIGIYASRSWLNSYIDCPRYDKWNAQWGSNNGTVQVDSSDIGNMLQYTSKPLDKDLIYKPVSHFDKYKGDIEPVKKKLVVDGVLGYESVWALQEWLGTYHDGEVSGQLKGLMGKFPALISVTYGGGGSAVIKQLQNYLIHEGFKVGASGEDGLLGSDTITALQEFLKGRGYEITDKKGILSTSTAKALQKHLNNKVYG